MGPAEEKRKELSHDVLSIEAADQIRPGHTSDTEARWGSFWEFAAACFSYLLHPHGSSIFTLQLYSRGGGFAVFFSILTVLFGAPMLMFEVALGQSTLSHAVDAFRICPIVQGLGYGMLVCTMMMVIYENVSLGSSGVFAMMALVISESINDTEPELTKMPSGYQTYAQYVGSLHSDNEGAFGAVRMEMLICIIFSWIIIIIAALNIGVHYSKAAFIIVVMPFELLLLWLSITVLKFPGARDGFGQFFGIKTEPDFEMAVMAFLQMLLSMGLGSGALVRMGSLARFRWPRHSWWAYGMAIAVVCKEFLFSVLTSATIGAAAAARGESVHDFIHMQMIGLELKVLTAALDYASFPNFWGTFVFALYWCAELYYCMVLTKWIVSGLKSMIRTLLKSPRNLQMPVTLVWCLLCIGVGIIFCFKNTVFYGNLWELHQPNWAIGALCMTEMIAGVYCFGPKEIIVAFAESMGYILDWYSRICWLLLPVLISISMLVSLNVAYARRTDSDHWTCSRADCLDGLPSMVVVLAPVAVVALHNIRVYTLKGTIGELIRPKRRDKTQEQTPLEEISVHGESLGSGMEIKTPETPAQPKLDIDSQINPQTSTEDTTK